MTPEQESEYADLSGKIALHRRKTSVIEQRFEVVARSLDVIAKAIADSRQHSSSRMARPIISVVDNDTYAVRHRKGSGSLDEEPRPVNVPTFAEINDLLRCLEEHDKAIAELQDRVRRIEQ